MEKERILGYLKLCLVSMISGALIGCIVGVYQLGITFFVHLSQNMYSSREVFMIIAMVFIIIALTSLNLLLIEFSPSLEGSGIPNMELGIRGQRKITWKKNILGMIANSYASTFAGFTLGSEGPSVVVAGNVAKMVNDATKTDDEETIAMACGTGFGCAFLSPLAGICYIFEESLHKFHPKYIFRGVLMMLTAFFVTSLINHHHLLSITNVALPNFSEYYIFIILIILNALVGILFTKIIVFVKRFIKKHKNLKIMKLRGIVSFLLTMILCFICYPLMGGGSMLIGSISTYTLLLPLFGILLFRFFMTILSGTSKVTGGLVVPMMTLGAITGQIALIIASNLFKFNLESSQIIILISMCMVFGVVTKTPFTATALVYSTILAFTQDFAHSLIIIPAAFVAIYAAFYISKLMKVDCLYEQFMDIALED